MSFPAYPAYKDSGVEWLGEMPDHWKLLPFKHIADFVNGMAFKPEDWSDEGVPIIRIENLNESPNFNCFEGSVDFRYHVNEGDLLFGWSGNRGTSFGPFIWMGCGLHYLNQHIFRIADFSGNKKWLYWALKAVTKSIEDQAHGIIGMVHITKGKLGGIKLPSVIVEEQTQIARFLDYETARIDALIEEQQRLIELLKEKRQAVISHAVTKGLDPTVPMKDSGVEWLGEVPAHWDVIRLRHCVADGLSYGANESAGDDNPDHPRYIRITDLNDDGSLDAETYRSLPPDVAKPYILKHGDVLFARSGATVGKSFIYSIEYGQACYAGYLIKATVDSRKLQPKYLWMYTQSRHYEQFIGESNIKATIQNVSAEKYGNLWISLPSIAEQEVILRALERQSIKFNELIEFATTNMGLLKERRSALISAAVTGKIDVRGWQPPISAASPELEKEAV